MSSGYKTEYRVARVVTFVVSVLGWLSVIAGGTLSMGAVAAVTAVGKGMNLELGGDSMLAALPGIAALLPGLGALVFGFLLIMGAQVTRATVDNADHTRELLKAINSR